MMPLMAQVTAKHLFDTREASINPQPDIDIPPKLASAGKLHGFCEPVATDGTRATEGYTPSDCVP
jgi:hypothetical protein